MAKKKLNRAATLKNIAARASQSIGIEIDTAGFNRKVKEDGDSFVIEAAKFVGAEIVYY